MPKAAAIYGLYTASVYLAGLPGGWVADKILGLRGAVLIGGVLIACGHVSLILDRLGFFYTGLLLIVIGTGLLKANISAIVGQLYAPGDTRRDGGFSLFYMGINLGGFLSPLACGYLDQRVGWHWGFGLAALGMTVAVVQFVRGQKHLGHAGIRTIPSEARRKALGQLLVGSLVCAAVACAILFFLHRRNIEVTAQGISTSLGLLLVTVVTCRIPLALLCRGMVRRRAQETCRHSGSLSCLRTILVLVRASGIDAEPIRGKKYELCCCWGHSFPSSWFQSLGSLFIILFAPVFAWFWIWLGPRDPSSPRKFTGGLVFAGLGFAVLILPLAAGMGRVSPAWLVLTYLLHTFGELSVSPVGLSAMTKLAPARAAGLIMGVWFLSTSLGNYLGSRTAGLYESMPLAKLFALVAGAAFAGALLLGLLAKRIEHLIEGPVPNSAGFS